MLEAVDATGGKPARVPALMVLARTAPTAFLGCPTRAGRTSGGLPTQLLSKLGFPRPRHPPDARPGFHLPQPLPRKEETGEESGWEGPRFGGL